MMVGYNVKYDFGIAFTTNSNSPLNCSLQPEFFGHDAFFMLCNWWC